MKIYGVMLMKYQKLTFFVMALILLTIPPSEAHRSGCHRWHSCPSDSGSYVCGDLGYTSGCPSTSAKNTTDPITKTPSNSNTIDPMPSSTAPASITAPATPTCDFQACAAKTSSYCFGTTKATEKYSCVGSTCVMERDAKTDNDCASKYCAKNNQEWNGEECKANSISQPSCDSRACAAKTTSYCDGTTLVTKTYSCMDSGCSIAATDIKVTDECGSIFCKASGMSWDGSKCKAKCSPLWSAEGSWSECVNGAQERVMSDGCGNEKKETRNCDVGCKGKARCFNGTITKNIDGDTLVVGDTKIRLALVNTPEFYQRGYSTSKAFTANLCKKGSTAIVDQDDSQLTDKYGRMVAVVYCQGKNLNKELLENKQASVTKKYCKVSEFGTETWAHAYGC